MYYELYCRFYHRVEELVTEHMNYHDADNSKT